MAAGALWGLMTGLGLGCLHMVGDEWGCKWDAFLYLSVRMLGGSGSGKRCRGRKFGFGLFENSLA